MAIVTVQKLKAWSFSRWQTYQTCPARAKFKIIDKLTEPGSAAMDRGTAIHKLAEDYTQGLLKRLPAELKAFKVEFLALKKSGAIVEENWGFTRDWNPCMWNDWTNCWLRIKMDACYVDDDNWLVVIDHKTGKPKDDHKDQLSLYALTGMIMFPDVLGVRSKLWYLDAGTEDGTDFQRKQFPTLQKEWEQKVKAMMNDTKFAPRPGASCRWCHYSKLNQGPCKF